MKGLGKIIRVKTWGEFKGLALALNPKSIVYNLHRAPLSKPPLCLRLTFASEQSQYVFLDFAQGDAFRETKIPIHKANRGEASVEDEGIRDFLRKELGRTDLLVICPVWRLEWR